jgi:hypothetical protein
MLPGRAPMSITTNYWKTRKAGTEPSDYKELYSNGRNMRRLQKPRGTKQRKLQQTHPLTVQCYLKEINSRKFVCQPDKGGPQ